MKFAAKAVMGLVLLGGFWVALAAEPALGVVTANGSFRLNHAAVQGNATLFAGAVIETTGTPSRLWLKNGPRLELGARAKARVYRDRLVLESGMSDFSHAGKYRIEAGALRIAAATKDSRGRVVRAGKTAVQVAALQGALRVYTRSGLLVANVAPGFALEFDPQQAGVAPPSSFLGCLLKKQGKFILYDQTTRLIVELRGGGLEKEWGNRVQVTGTTDTSATSEVGAQVVDVTSVTRFGQGGCGPVASAINAELPPGAKPAAPAPRPKVASGRPAGPAHSAPAPHTGMSAGVKVALIGAIGGGGAAAAMLATKSSDKSRSQD